jgi:hypothetical protein
MTDNTYRTTKTCAHCTQPVPDDFTPPRDPDKIGWRWGFLFAFAFLLGQSAVMLVRVNKEAQFFDARSAEILDVVRETAGLVGSLASSSATRGVRYQGPATVGGLEVDDGIVVEGAASVVVGPQGVCFKDGVRVRRADP